MAFDLNALQFTAVSSRLHTLVQLLTNKRICHQVAQRRQMNFCLTSSLVSTGCEFWVGHPKPTPVTIRERKRK